jgi:hypothetical protein
MNSTGVTSFTLGDLLDMCICHRFRRPHVPSIQGIKKRYHLSLTVTRALRYVNFMRQLPLNPSHPANPSCES